MIDLTDRPPATVPPPLTPEQSALRAALTERRRAEARTREAHRELEELRRRHWSAQRVFEESRLDIDFWEHPLADPYAVLGLLPGAGLEAAAAARRRIARECHPDVAGGGDADPELVIRMTAANAAYERLRRALSPRAADRSASA